MASTTISPIPEEEQHAKWASYLADVERRIEEVRQLKPIDQSPRLIIMAVAIAVTVFAAGMVIGGLLVYVLLEHG